MEKRAGHCRYSYIFKIKKVRQIGNFRYFESILKSTGYGNTVVDCFCLTYLKNILYIIKFELSIFQ